MNDINSMDCSLVYSMDLDVLVVFENSTQSMMDIEEDDKELYEELMFFLDDQLTLLIQEQQQQYDETS